MLASFGGEVSSPSESVSRQLRGVEVPDRQKHLREIRIALGLGRETSCLEKDEKWKRRKIGEKR